MIEVQNCSQLIAYINIKKLRKSIIEMYDAKLKII